MSPGWSGGWRRRAMNVVVTAHNRSPGVARLGWVRAKRGAAISVLPVVDVSTLVGRPGPPVRQVARDIERACRDSGFFYVVGHGVPAGLLSRLDTASRRFFALPVADKMEIAMRHGGAAWRGYFPVGAELTSGRPDRKEGLYFGVELDADDPRVRAGLPLHGRNLFPRQVPELREAVLDYLEALTATAQAVLRGVAVSLDLDADYFAERVHGRSDGAVPDLPLPALGAGQRRLGRRRAHRLRPAHPPGPGRQRRPAGAVRRTAGSTRRRFRTRSCATSATCSTG